MRGLREERRVGAVLARRIERWLHRGTSPLPQWEGAHPAIGWVKPKDR